MYVNVFLLVPVEARRRHWIPELELDMSHHIDAGDRIIARASSVLNQ